MALVVNIQCLRSGLLSGSVPLSMPRTVAFQSIVILNEFFKWPGFLAGSPRECVWVSSEEHYWYQSYWKRHSANYHLSILSYGLLILICRRKIRFWSKSFSKAMISPLPLVWGKAVIYWEGTQSYGLDSHDLAYSSFLWPRSSYFTCFLHMKHLDQYLPWCYRDTFGTNKTKVVRINVMVLCNIQKSNINDQSLYFT